MTFAYYLSRPFAWILSIFQIHDTLFNAVNTSEVSIPLIVMGIICFISCILFILNKLFYLYLYLFKKVYKPRAISSGNIFRRKAIRNTLLSILCTFFIISAMLWIVIAIKGIQPFAL
mgnify:CR=1 FL=1